MGCNKMESHLRERRPLRTKIIILSNILIFCLIMGLVSTIVIQQKSNQQRVLQLQEQLNDVITEKEELSTYIERLELDNISLNTKIFEYNQQLLDYEKLLKEQKFSNPLIADSGFRSYMPSSAITDKTSKQYSLKQQATVNNDGLLEINGYVLVAIGTGWGISVGERATVITENGSYNIIVADIKANCHTDSTNKVTVLNGCVVEFIVNISKLDRKVKTSGNIATISKYSGKVLQIKKV